MWKPISISEVMCGNHDCGHKLVAPAAEQDK
ncbi:hypothetical protein CsSME_00036574 [Camellia sinensis var. sinensis]